MTKCKNRTALEWVYDGHYDSTQSIGVIMCDLNGLKKVNDSYGHESGDKYICDAAEVLTSCFGTENVYRIGGDEFAVILLGEEEKNIQKMMEQAQVYCELKKVSISFGRAYRKHAKEPFESIMREADKIFIHGRNEK